ncbi:Rieske family iron-sulfur cluster-binding protein [Corallococcus coralloides]|uniref:Rieske family iron-sulfur cluster-binding protein n=1 Tax=Corallococcus coralloides TaxID=184914 RepID=A0A410RR10_CORCK|nr:MBL fold metallo-hydrolase [Corallococcus coralloides]QAT84335.1 Rieske family iron-sulfur cluster-binding protein [Corallococcus coralloides]
MRITVLGHAGLYVEAAGERILIDPVLRDTPLGHGSLVFYPGRRLAPDAVPGPTLLVISHAHWDHFDLESLERLPRDVPVVAPNEASVLTGLRRMGFARVTALESWQSHVHGGVKLTATPSAGDITEMGVLLEAEGTRFWDMVDAEVGPEVGERILAEHGRVHIVAAKYQPQGKLQVQLLWGLGTSFDKRDVARSLEAASVVQPQFVFPYACGLAFQGMHAWMNKQIFPFTQPQVVRLLRARLPQARAEQLRPGDVLEHRDGGVTLHAQASPFVRHEEALHDQDWEPLDSTSLDDPLTPAEADDTRREVEALLAGPFARWLRAHFATEGYLRAFIEYRVVWQLVVHLGPGRRLAYALDFRAPRLALLKGMHEDANYFVHVSGRGLTRSIRRPEISGDLFNLCGDLRLFEKVLGVVDGHFFVPPVAGKELLVSLPDPLTLFFRQAPASGPGLAMPAHEERA